MKINYIEVDIDKFEDMNAQEEKYLAAFLDEAVFLLGKYSTAELTIEEDHLTLPLIRGDQE